MRARTEGPPETAQHATHNAMRDPGEIARFYDCCSDLMARSTSGRWEMWMDAAQARAVRAEQRD